MEATAAKAVQDVTTKTIQAADSTMKKFWSILDAATEKKPPSEYLSQKGIDSMQGQGS